MRKYILAVAAALLFISSFPISLALAVDPSQYDGPTVYDGISVRYIVTEEDHWLVTVPDSLEIFPDQLVNGSFSIPLYFHEVVLHDLPTDIKYRYPGLYVSIRASDGSKLINEDDPGSYVTFTLPQYGWWGPMEPDNDYTVSIKGKYNPIINGETGAYYVTFHDFDTEHAVSPGKYSTSMTFKIYRGYTSSPGANIYEEQ